MTMLNEHEGRDVMEATVKIIGAGTGLSDALRIAPAEYRIGEKIYVVLETECARYGYEPVTKDADVDRRVHWLRTTTGTIVDADAVAAMLDAHAIAVEKAKGVHRLPLSDGDDAGED